MAKFAIEWGVPEMEELWADLSRKVDRALRRAMATPAAGGANSVNEAH